MNCTGFFNHEWGLIRRGRDSIIQEGASEWGIFEITYVEQKAIDKFYRGRSILDNSTRRDLLQRSLRLMNHDWLVKVNSE